MPFTKPYNYVDGTVLEAGNQFLNEEGAKEFVNQEISVADYIAKEFDFDELEAGEFQPVTNNHKFCSGYIAGKNVDINVNNKAWFTSNVKANTEAGTSVSWVDLWSAGEQVSIVEGSAKVLITFEADFEGLTNNTTAGGGTIVNGLWDNELLLRHTDYSANPTTTTFITGTRMWGFEGTGATPFGTVDPGESGFSASRRQVMLQYFMTLDRGIHDLQICVNPKIQAGCLGPRNLTVEVFYL